jgi:hypothetical protein
MARDWSPVVLDTINSSSDATSYDGNSVTLTIGRTYVVSNLNSKTSTPDAPASIQLVGGAQAFIAKGTALLWGTSGTPLKRHRFWICKCTVTSTAVWRIDFGANTQTGCRAVLWEIPDTTATDPYVNETQAFTDTNDASLACTPNAPVNSDSLFIAASMNALNSSSDAVSGTGWTGVGGGLANPTPNMTLESAYNEGGSATQASWTGAGSSARAIHVIEIGAPAAGSNVPEKAHHFGMMRAA